ncbi:hypothetical protein KoPa4_00043 [Pseudomonas phage vB_PpuM-KoPa-4]|uniref:Uncharacterized protein n=1 Tax=Pseudomonas phage vB_PpuM-KoPa-4 TaxID=3132618 RepID=A0AAX4MWS3_9CAUD
MEVKLGDIVKFRLVNGFKDHTGEIIRVILDSEKDPHVTNLLNYDYVVAAADGLGRMYELNIYKREILEVL